MKKLLLSYNEKYPQIGKKVFIAPTAALIGDVVVGDNASIWFNVVLRGDESEIRIGKNSNVQDNSVIHADENESAEIGTSTTVGHNVIIHSSHIGSNCVIGMGSIVLNRAEVGDSCIVGAGSLITLDSKFPPGMLILGSPARVVRKLLDKDHDYIRENVRRYLGLKDEYTSMNS